MVSSPFLSTILNRRNGAAAIAEETAGPDRLRDIRRHHLFPRWIARLDAGERFARGEIQIFRAIILQRLDVARFAGGARKGGADVRAFAGCAR